MGLTRYIEPTEHEKKLLLATVVEVGVRTVFETHLYQFAGSTYHQQAGGPIGLRATGAIAGIVMGQWDISLMKLLADNEMTVQEAARYVDDVRVVMHAINLGWRWEAGKMIYQDEWKKEEEEEGLSETAKTASVMKTIMNSIMKEVQFTTETHEEFKTNTLPTLDTELWIEQGRIKYRYFEKPMSNKMVISKQSAMAENSKIAALRQDLVRRLKNTSLELDQIEWDRVIDNYSVKLISSGYDRKQVHRVVTAGLKGFERLLYKQEQGLGNIHRPAASNRKARNKKKLLGKSNWFRKKKDVTTEKPKRLDCANNRGPHNKKPSTKLNQGKNDKMELKTTTVLFIEHTPNGELARRFREAEVELSRITGFKVKVVERNGASIKSILHKANPWAEGCCSRQDCYPCSTGDKHDCFKKNIVYTNTCNQCEVEGKKQFYVGESARSSHERGGEHIRDFRGKKQDSHILKHLEVVHPGQAEPDFKFRVRGTFKSALERQVTEAVMIRRAGEATLNSKGVYNRCYLPRLVVECGKKENEKEPLHMDVQWQERKQPKRSEHSQRNRRPQKRMKIDIAVDSARQEGLQKRQAAIGSLDEFERECKRRRPDFDPSKEEDLWRGDQDNFQQSIKSKPQLIFFSIFTKENKKLNNDVMFRSSRKSKVKPKPKSKTKTNSSQPGESKNATKSKSDIRFFMNEKPSLSNLEVGVTEEGTDRRNQQNLPLDMASPKSSSNLDQKKVQLEAISRLSEGGTGQKPTEDRGAKSGVVTWDLGIKGGRSKQLMSTDA